jgi:hypothetical protein
MILSSSLEAEARDWAASCLSSAQLLGGLLEEIGGVAVGSGGLNGAGDFIESLGGFFGGESAGFQLVNHIFKRALRGVGLAELELFGKVFAGMARLLLKLLQGLGHVLEFVQVGRGGIEVVAEGGQLAGLQGGDGAFQVGERLAHVPGLLGEVGKGLGQLVAGVAGAGSVALGHVGEGLFGIMQLGGKFLDGFGSFGGFAKGFLQSFHLPLRGGGVRTAAGLAGGFFE